MLNIVLFVSIVHILLKIGVEQHPCQQAFYKVSELSIMMGIRASTTYHLNALQPFCSLLNIL